MEWRDRSLRESTGVEETARKGWRWLIFPWPEREIANHFKWKRKSQKEKKIVLVNSTKYVCICSQEVRERITFREKYSREIYCFNIISYSYLFILFYNKLPSCLCKVHSMFFLYYIKQLMVQSYTLNTVEHENVMACLYPLLMRISFKMSSVTRISF